MLFLKDHQSKVYTYGGRLRQHLIGAVDPDRGDLHIAFSNTLKSEQFRHFLCGPLSRYPKANKLIVVLDNAWPHHSKQLKNFLESHKERLELVFLPKYSPDLNPMGWFWKYLRKNVTHNTFFGDFNDFRRALAKFILKYTSSSPEIRSRCSYAKLFNAL